MKRRAAPVGGSLGAIEIRRDGGVSVREIREIRDSIGLRPETRGYAKAMRLSHSYFTARKDGRLDRLRQGRRRRV